MKNNGYRIISVLLIMLFLIPNTGIAISKTPYTGYTYDAWGKSIPAPSGYECVSVFYPQTTGCGSLNGASDLFVYNGELYIVDTGNNRIVVLDHNYDFVRELNSVMMPDGTESALTGPRGVYLRDETMIVADTGNARVLICDMNGTVRMVLEKPETEFIAEGIAFRPTKVVQDASGFFYVVAEGIYQGILCYDSNGRFAGFFGSNKVKVTLSVIIGQLWKKILSQDQAQSMERYIPVEVANIFIDSDDFIFSLTNGSVGYDRATGTIQRLNPLGVNVLHYNERDVDASGGALYRHDEYGDVEYANIKSKMVDTTFIDVYVDENGVFSALDRERGRIFQYDQESNLLFIFGGIGNQKGSFSIPSAIEKFNGNYIVLDERNNTISIFAETEYAQLVLEATKLFNDGLYKEAEPIWREVLRINSFNTMAYRSIGKYYLEEKEYRNALKYLKLGEDRDGYSMAYTEYRKIWLQNNIIWFAPACIAAIVGFTKLLRLLLKKLGFDKKRTKIVFK